MNRLEAWRAVREEARQMEERHRAERAEVHARRDRAHAELISSEKDAIRAAYPAAQMYYDDNIGILTVWADGGFAHWHDTSTRPGGIKLAVIGGRWTAFKRGSEFPTALEALQAALKPYVPTPRPADDGRPV